MDKSKKQNKRTVDHDKIARSLRAKRRGPMSVCGGAFGAAAAAASMVNRTQRRNR